MMLRIISPSLRTKANKGIAGRYVKPISIQAKYSERVSQHRKHFTKAWFYGIYVYDKSTYHYSKVI